MVWAHQNWSVRDESAHADIIRAEPQEKECVKNPIFALTAPPISRSHRTRTNVSANNVNNFHPDLQSLAFVNYFPFQFLIQK